MKLRFLFDFMQKKLNILIIIKSISQLGATSETNLFKTAASNNYNMGEINILNV